MVQPYLRWIWKKNAFCRKGTKKDNYSLRSRLLQTNLLIVTPRSKGPSPFDGNNNYWSTLTKVFWKQTNCFPLPLPLPLPFKLLREGIDLKRGNCTFCNSTFWRWYYGSKSYSSNTLARIINPLYRYSINIVIALKEKCHWC